MSFHAKFNLAINYDPGQKSASYLLVAAAENRRHFRSIFRVPKAKTGSEFSTSPTSGDSFPRSFLILQSKSFPSLAVKAAGACAMSREDVRN